MFWSWGLLLAATLIVWSLGPDFALGDKSPKGGALFVVESLAVAIALHLLVAEIRVPL